MARTHVKKRLRTIVMLAILLICFLIAHRLSARFRATLALEAMGCAVVFDETPFDDFRKHLTIPKSIAATVCNTDSIRLRMDHCTDSATVASLLREMGLVHDLDMSGSTITGTVLGHVLECTQPRVLNLARCSITGDYCSQSACSRLEFLNLSGSSMAQESYTDLLRTRSLKYICLDGTNVQDSVATHLAALPLLIGVSCCQCCITSAFIDEIAKCQRLLLLDVRDTSITTVDLVALYKNQCLRVVLMNLGQHGEIASALAPVNRRKSFVVVTQAQ